MASDIRLSAPNSKPRSCAPAGLSAPIWRLRLLPESRPRRAPAALTARDDERGRGSAGLMEAAVHDVVATRTVARDIATHPMQCVKRSLTRVACVDRGGLDWRPSPSEACRPKTSPRLRGLRKQAEPEFKVNDLPRHPAKAGTRFLSRQRDPRFRGGDGKLMSWLTGLSSSRATAACDAHRELVQRYWATTPTTSIPRARAL